MKHTTNKFLIIFLLLVNTVHGKDYIVSSPDGKNSVTVTVDKDITWSISHNKVLLIKPSPIAMEFTNKVYLGRSPKVLNFSTKSFKNVIEAAIPIKNKLIQDEFTLLQITFEGNYSLQFRAYNDGLAYRFVTDLGVDKYEVKNEVVSLDFDDNCQVYMPKEEDPEFQSHYEGLFKATSLENIPSKQYGYLPLYVATNTGVKMVISESDLVDYPNLFFYGSGGKELRGAFPQVVLETKPTNNIHLDETIVRKADYIAKTTGRRNFPWRIVAIAENDKELLINEIVYKLARTNKLQSTSWIKPGKSAWDWWNDVNVYGVPFKAGINTATYKYYIDFAAKYGLEYVVLDEGWAAKPDDILHTNPDVNLVELLAYAKNRKVGIILWALWKPIDGNMDKILETYAAWGVKGVKVDFMARADQYMVNFYERLAETAAKHKLVLDLHGAYKPVGLNRTYPNVLSYEGVRGLEQCKWDTIITPQHNVTLPFTRMFAGPMDFTPGAMVNSNQKEFQINWSAPMSRGTRAHQAAMYVVYESPLQMLCDNPSNYVREPEFSKFISRIPTVWDKTLALEGKIGEYVVFARKRNSIWYIGGMTDWNARSFKIPLTFLQGKKYKVEILKDGANVSRRAEDYVIETKTVSSGQSLNIDLAPGGGYTAIITPI